MTAPAPSSVYQTEHNGNFTYTIPGLEPGRDYLVRLHFAEIYHSSTGSRVFDVSINGEQVLNDYDIYAETGARYAAVVHEYTTDANADGQIVIGFVTVTDNAKVSAIEILNAPSAPEIIEPPVRQTVVAGGTAVFTVSAAGYPTPSYLWMKNGAQLDGETGETLTISSAQTADKGMYSVVVYNSEGCVISTNVALAVGSVSSAPTGLFATPGNNQVELNWCKATDATSYKVKRLLAGGSGTYGLIATVTDTTYTDLTALNDNTYFYIVTAVDAEGEVDSSAVIVTPTAEAGAITIQVEDASVTYGGGVTMDSNNSGFHVTGFVNFPSTDGYVQFNQVPGGTGGDAVLGFRFALGNTARTGTLYVNGVASDITFPSTTLWTTWSSMSLPITLNAGTDNVIRIESIGSDLSNIDEITIVPTVKNIPIVGPAVNALYNDGVFSLDWSYTNSGWMLQYSTNLLMGEWVDISSSEETNCLKFPVDTAPWDTMFFRLTDPD